MIHILEKSVADKIAAGEVIDRPASIIKELVENSIDAGADDITVEIRNGGKSYIRVTDNGCGIEQEDVENAFMRHATSKIEKEGDLRSIGTLGFRGEALASIHAVSRVELITKTAGSKVGRRVVAEGSEIIANEGTGCPDGTTVTVRDLFYNTPARKKFMNSDNSESRRIIDLMSRMALAYGDIKITMINGKKTVFTTQGKNNIFNNIVSIYGKDTGRDLLPVEGRRGDMILKGYISRPSFSASSRSRQIFSVNGRIIASRVIEKAVEEAYREKLFEGRFPVVFIFMSVDPAKLDVNIHPTKKEIRFDDNHEVEDFITKACMEALNGRESFPVVRQENLKINEKSRDFISTLNRVTPERKEDEGRQTDLFHREEPMIDREEDFRKTLDMVEEEKKENDDDDIGGILSHLRDEEEKKKAVLPEPERRMGPFDFSSLELIGCIFDTYILAKDDDCFYMLDQHAAHERVYYEQFCAQYHDQELVTQKLLIPLDMDVSAQVCATEDMWMESLRQLGYDVEFFGGRTYIVREIPAFISMKEAESFLADFFLEMEDSPDLTNTMVLDRVIMRSCKSAVKGGDHLEDEEIKALFESLKKCRNPFSCPHGRPTFIRMSRYEIEKMFKRV